MVALAVGIAGVNGGLLGLVDATIVQSPIPLIALIVVMMLSLYAHSKGDGLGATLPRHFSLHALRRQTLSADVVRVVGGIGHATVRPHGEVDDVEAYPPLPPELRREFSTSTREFPADVPLAELEARLEDRLRTEHGLADVVASVDSEGRATIAAAPPTGGLSRRVPDGHRAVSVPALVPSGIARGEQVRIEAGGQRFGGPSSRHVPPPAARARRSQRSSAGCPDRQRGADQPCRGLRRAPTSATRDRDPTPISSPHPELRT